MGLFSDKEGNNKVLPSDDRTPSTISKVGVSNKVPSPNPFKQDPSSPTTISIPTSAQPTEVLCRRFHSWRSVIKSLIVYLTEVISIQDEIIRQQSKLTKAIQFPIFTLENQYQPATVELKEAQQHFIPLGNGSIQDVPTILNEYHTTTALHASKISKELTFDVIPRLKDLRRDLLVKIKEIGALQSDFKNICEKELKITKQLMERFQDSFQSAIHNEFKQDPYLMKLSLDQQIKKQIVEENYLRQAFNNLQNSGAQLEHIVVMEMQNAVTIYAKLIGQENQLVFDQLVSKLDSGFLNQTPLIEWENFIVNNSPRHFVVPNMPLRDATDLTYKDQSSPLTYEIRSGFLEKRSKFLKNYTTGFYVLTGSFLHEFKSANRKNELTPSMSLCLSQISGIDCSKSTSSVYKLSIHMDQNGLMNRGQTWILKANTYETMASWYKDIKSLSSFKDNTLQKCIYITEKLERTRLNSSSPTHSRTTPRPSYSTTRSSDRTEPRTSTSTFTDMDDSYSRYSFQTQAPKYKNQSNAFTALSSGNSIPHQ